MSKKLANKIWDEHKGIIDSFDLICTNGHNYTDERDCQAIFHAINTLIRMEPSKDVLSAIEYLKGSKHYSESNNSSEY